jgi:hypothetical protein
MNRKWICWMENLFQVVKTDINKGMIIRENYEGSMARDSICEGLYLEMTYLKRIKSE